MTKKNNPKNKNNKENKTYKHNGSNWQHNRFMCMLDNDKPQYKCLAIGEHNGVFYFGIVLYEGEEKYQGIVTSDKKYYVNWGEARNEIKDIFGLNYKYEIFDDAIYRMWSQESIKKYLSNEYEPKSIKEIFDSIVKINSKYVEHVDKVVHYYIACDIISNYFYPIFNAKGRTYFHAEHESGKSKQTSIYLLCSFNALMAGNITKGSFDRIVESTGGTVCVDNFDNISDDLKRDIAQIMEVFYKRGTKSVKCDGRNNKPSTFEGYCPLILNNIIGLNEVTESRCNTINMMRTQNEKIANKKIDYDDKEWDKLRDDLHILSLDNWKDVKKVYETLNENRLFGRDLEKTEAVLTIAKCVGDDIYEKMIEYLKNMIQEQKVQNIDYNWEFIAFKLMNQSFEWHGSKFETFKMKELSKDIARQLGEENNPTTIRRIATSLGKSTFGKYSSLFKKKHISGGWVAYEIGIDGFNKILKLKGFDKLLHEQEEKKDNIEEVDLSNMG